MVLFNKLKFKQNSFNIFLVNYILVFNKRLLNELYYTQSLTTTFRSNSYQLKLKDFSMTFCVFSMTRFTNILCTHKNEKLFARQAPISNFILIYQKYFSKLFYYFRNTVQRRSFVSYIHNSVKTFLFTFCFNFVLSEVFMAYRCTQFQKTKIKQV